MELPACFVTWFDGGTRKPAGRQELLSWPELWGRLEAAQQLPHISTRRNPGWSPASFKDDYRSKANMLLACAIGLDFDSGRISIERVKELLGGLYGFIHTTRSHMVAARKVDPNLKPEDQTARERFRVIIVLDCPVTLGEYKACWTALNHHFAAEGGEDSVDDAAADGSRFWFMPSQPYDKSTEVDYEGGFRYDPDGPDYPAPSFAYLMGQPASAAALVAEGLELMKPKAPAPQPAAALPAFASSAVDDGLRRSAEAWFMKQYTTLASTKSERNNALNIAVRTTYGRMKYVDVLGDDRIQREFRDLALRMGLGEQETLGTIDSGRRSGIAKQLPDDPRPDPTQTLAGTRQGLHLVPPPGTEPAKPPPTIEWVYANEVFEPLPPAKWVVRGLHIGPGRPTIVMGYGASGKTLMLQSMGLCVAVGAPVWGHFSSERGVFRHLDYEQGKAATYSRYQRLAIGHGIDPRSLGTHFAVATFPDVKLDSEGAADAYSRACEGADLVIVDSVKAATPNTNENESVIRGCIDTLTKVSERTGTSFVLIHHAGKDVKGGRDSRQIGRGSSAIFDATGCQLYISPGETLESPRNVEQTKRPAEAMGAGLMPFCLAIEDVERLGNAEAGLKVVYGPRKEKLTKEEEADASQAQLFMRQCQELKGFVTEHQGISKSQMIMRGPVRNKTALNSALAALEKRGEVHVGRLNDHEAYYADMTK